MKAVTVDDQEIGRLIREARIRKNLTVKDIAPCIVVSKAQMQKYELGQNRISAANLIKIAEFMEVDVGELLGVQPSISPQARTLALAFDRLADATVKAQVFDLVLAAAKVGEVQAQEPR